MVDPSPPKSQVVIQVETLSSSALCDSWRVRSAARVVLRELPEAGAVISASQRLGRGAVSLLLGSVLALITLGEAAGFSLDEIASMFGVDGRPRIDRAMLVAKAEELDRSIARLSAMRDGLRHAARCPQADHMDCPTFRRILAAANLRGRRSRSGHRIGTSAVKRLK